MINVWLGSGTYQRRHGNSKQDAMDTGFRVLETQGFQTESSVTLVSANLAIYISLNHDVGCSVLSTRKESTQLSPDTSVFANAKRKALIHEFDHG